MTEMDALKYGPAGLAALVAIWTSGLLTIELQRAGGVRQSAYKLIKTFMVFSLVLLGVSTAIALIDRYYADKRDRVMSEIRVEVSALNTEVLGKMREQAFSEEEISREIALRLNSFTDSICRRTNKIAELASASQPAAKCREEANPSN